MGLKAQRNWFLGATFGALLIAIPMVPTEAVSWWSCAAGYDLQIRSNNSNHVRCFRPAQSTAINTNCPQVTLANGSRVGSGLVQDYYATDGRDACVTQDPTGTAKTAVPHAFCSSGWQHQPRAGARDVCTQPSSQVAPTINVP